MRILIDHEKVNGLYLVETIGKSAPKRILDSFLTGQIMSMKMEKLSEAAEKEIYEAKCATDTNVFHTVVHEDLKIDGIARIYENEQHLMLYGSKYGHVYHYPIVKYPL